ncbi:MAG: RNA polymerase sigma factor [Bacteroidia bacterium]|nr:RNA polymerase sigma factor [Bacteroidia bacterium]
MPNLTAQALREQLSQGHTHGLRQVFEETHRYCVRTLMHKTGCDASDAEDLYMDAVLIFRENILSGRLAQLSNLRSYMYGICWNLWRDLNRSRSRWEREQNEIERQFWLAAGKSETPFEPEDADLVRERIRRVTEALGRLGQTCRELLNYVYVEQLPQQEIAARMGFANANVVKVTRHRCYQQWMKLIDSPEIPAHGTS